MIKNLLYLEINWCLAKAGYKFSNINNKSENLLDNWHTQVTLAAYLTSLMSTRLVKNCFKNKPSEVGERRHKPDEHTMVAKPTVLPIGCSNNSTYFGHHHPIHPFPHRSASPEPYRFPCRARSRSQCFVVRNTFSVDWVWWSRINHTKSQKGSVRIKTTRWADAREDDQHSGMVN